METEHLMEKLVKLYELLDKEMNTPTVFGRFHIACLCITLLISIIVCRSMRNAPERTVNRFIGFVWVVIVVLEIYKQLNFSFSVEEGRLVWDYSWYAFPFQFCSSPLYILPVIAFRRDGRLRDCAISYMACFSFFAGLAVMIYPGNVYMSTIGINIQTMVHHGMQVVLGAMLAVRYRSKMNARFYFKGVRLFVLMCALAIGMNYGFYNYIRPLGIDETFNMFYISPNFECPLPLLGDIFEMILYPVFLAGYIIGFSFCAALMFVILRGIAGKGKSRGYEGVKAESSNMRYSTL